MKRWRWIWRLTSLSSPFRAADLVAVLRSKPPRPVRSNSSSTTASSTRPHRCGPASEKGEELKPVPYLSAPPNWGRKSLVGGREKGWCAAVGEDEEGWGRERGGGGSPRCQPGAEGDKGGGVTRRYSAVGGCESVIRVRDCGREKGEGVYILLWILGCSL